MASHNWPIRERVTSRAQIRSLGIRLLRRRRRREARQRGAGGLDPQQRRIEGEVELDPARVGKLRDEADVG